MPLMKAQLIKILLLLALLTGFYASDGFERPVLSERDFRSQPRMTRAWIATVILFLLGTVMALWGNAVAQNIQWDAPDGLYPTLGVLLMIAGLLWMLMVKGSV